MARRLRAAAEGGDYEEGLSDDDNAEISDMEAGSGPHPEALDGHGNQDAEEEQEEEEVDIMNSPVQRPWGAEVNPSPSASASLHACCCMLTCKCFCFLRLAVSRCESIGHSLLLAGCGHPMLKNTSIVPLPVSGRLSDPLLVVS